MLAPLRRDLRLLGDERAEILIAGRGGGEQKNENGERKGSKAAIGSGAQRDHALTTQGSSEAAAAAWMALQQIGVPAFADRQFFCRINLAIVLILRRESGFSRRFPQA